MRGKSKCLLIGSCISTISSATLEGPIDARKPTWEEMVYEARTFPQPSVFWTRDLWEQNGPLDESLYYVMDYSLWLGIRPRANSEIHLDQILSVARTHSEQKGKLTALKGAKDFRQERALEALRAARNRRETIFFWVAKVWFYHYKQALIENKPLRFKGSGFFTDIVHALPHVLRNN